MDARLHFRRAETADAAAIRALTRAAYAKWIPIIGREPKPMQADYDAAVCKHRFDLLYLGDDLVGLIETVDQGEALLIENVAVAPDFQGQGLGSRLMAHAQTVAEGEGRSSLALYTNKAFAENIRLYLRLGYAVSGEADVGGGTIRVDMRKALPSKAACELKSAPDRT